MRTRSGWSSSASSAVASDLANVRFRPIPAVSLRARVAVATAAVLLCKDSMHSDHETATLDFTANGVEFASWETDVKNDDLSLVTLTYAASPWVSYPQEGIKLEL